MDQRLGQPRDERLVRPFALDHQQVVEAGIIERPDDVGGVLTAADKVVLQRLFAGCHTVEVRMMHGGWSGAKVVTANALNEKGEECETDSVVKLDRTVDIILDDDGDSSDWIEVHNPTYEPVSIAGYHLTDDDDDLTRWTFPEVVLAPKGFVVIFASGKDRADPEAALHTDFKLSASGEYLALVVPDGTVIDEKDGWPPQVSDPPASPEPDQIA